MKLIQKLLPFTMVILSFLSASPRQPIGDHNRNITTEELFDHVAFLAADELQGRRPGTPGADISAEYIRNQFASYGLHLLGDNGFQTLSVLAAIEAGEDNFLRLNHFSGQLFTDYAPINFSDNGAVTAPFVFVGYGFDFAGDQLNWHDYKDVAVADKWVMILRDAPESAAAGDIFEPYRTMRKKVLVAKDKGAAGILFVSGESFDSEDRLVSLRDNPSTAAAGLPVLHIKRSVADLLLQKTSFTIAALEKHLNETLQPKSFAVEERVTAAVQLHKRFAPTHNVVALSPGNDPQLQNEYVVLGAHYDHLGMGGVGSGSRRPDTLAVHNGADDNASGVAALLEIAQKLALQTTKVHRSVLFVAFTAEELGTLGSRYFIDNPPVDLHNIHLMINMDMIGRFNDSTKAFTIGGTGTAFGLEEMVKKITAKDGTNPSFNPEGYGPSDHAVFYNRDIPVLFFMTSIHEDYHTPFDDVDKINVAGMKLLADVIYEIILETANQSDRLLFQEAGPKSPPTMGRRFKVTLGIMPDFVAGGIKGLRTEAVLPGRPAARAGMQKGDVIVAMEGRAVNDIYEYMNRLADFTVGQRISIEVLRNGEKHILIVEL